MVDVLEGVLREDDVEPFTREVVAGRYLPELAAIGELGEVPGHLFASDVNARNVDTERSARAVLRRPDDAAAVAAAEVEDRLVADREIIRKAREEAVGGGEPGRWWQHADEIREPVRVSEGLREDGRLRPEPMQRAIRTAELFDAFCKADDIETVQAVATSAIRDAPNGRELVEEVEARTSLPV